MRVISSRFCQYVQECLLLSIEPEEQSTQLHWQSFNEGSPKVMVDTSTITSLNDLAFLFKIAHGMAVSTLVLWVNASRRYCFSPLHFCRRGRQRRNASRVAGESQGGSMTRRCGRFSSGSTEVVFDSGDERSEMLDAGELIAKDSGDLKQGEELIAEADLVTGLQTVKEGKKCTCEKGRGFRLFYLAEWGSYCTYKNRPWQTKGGRKVWDKLRIDLHNWSEKGPDFFFAIEVKAPSDTGAEKGGIER